MREVRNVSELEDAKEFGKYLLRMKEKSQNFFFELELEIYQSIKIAFWVEARSRAAWSILEMYNLVFGSFVGLRCVGGNAPKGIVTNQCALMQRVYTHEKFREVQEQFRGKVNCIRKSTHSALGYTVSKSTFNKFAVTYDKNVKRRHTYIKTSHDEPLLESRSKRFDNSVFWSQNICGFASKSEELTAILHRPYDNAMVEMQEHKAKSKEKCLLSHEDASLEDLMSFKALHA
ncbi:hypothetical protein Ahy_A04g019419 [Arachis hypogaea]|uniref:Protein FAR1-RELATED SEQUENCE n=1 Tax=Arachis hypogaea TaxID=3818 RepID=A0A445DFX4_ARAHY|nr:hypothetical protein Ahy_A04g019419 [Arachis hypogaea]